MKKTSIYLFTLLCSFVFLNAKSQETQTDTLARVIEGLQADVAALKNLKISGYIQAQAQFADSLGAQTDMAAGKFPVGSDTRFLIRRGRLKFAYSTNPLSQYVMQIDVSETGVKTKEVYAKFTDPFINWFSVTGGLQNRPFGFEVEYSSGLLESPERARMNQSLFKDEYDLGAMLTIQAPKTSRYNFLKLDAGFFSGSIENVSSMDYKKTKDFIGRINFNKSFLEENLKVSGDISYYNGSVPNSSKKSFTVDNGVFVASADSLTKTTRQYYGADLQVSYASPIGLSTLRGEYTKGKQASALGDIKNPTALASSIYQREVEGYYVMFVQNILQSRHSILVKYDVFDPNTKVSGTDIKGKGFSASDIKYSDLGLGYICRIDSNIKLLVYYDINTNEKTGLAGYSKDVKDNVWTIRLQYKF